MVSKNLGSQDDEIKSYSIDKDNEVIEEIIDDNNIYEIEDNNIYEKEHI